MSDLISNKSPEDAPKGCPVYMIFKYVPNVQRMEPRNIGVVVWHQGVVVARLIDQPPEFVNTEAKKRVYRQWIEFWSKTIAKTEIEPYVQPGSSDPRTVSVEDPKYLDALATFGRGNYVLSYGGFIIDDVSKWETKDMADWLFTTLVL